MAPRAGPGAALARAALGPLGTASVICTLAALAVVAELAATTLPGGWVLTWLALGLTAGYALSGSV